jgi:hypothetical protein
MLVVVKPHSIECQDSSENYELDRRDWADITNNNHSMKMLEYQVL